MHKLKQLIAQHYSLYRTALGVGVVTTIANLGYGILNQSAIQPYAAALGWTVYLGGFYTAFVIAETAMKGPMGALEDRIGIRPVYIAAAVIGSFSALIWVAVHQVWWIFLVRVIDGAASAGVWTAGVVAMGGSVGTNGRTSAMELYILTYMIGLAFGPLVGGYANVHSGSLETSFFVASGMFLVAAVLAWFLVPKRAADMPEAEETPPPSMSLLSATLLGIRTIPSYMIIAFFTFVAIGLIMPVIKLFAMQQLGMSGEDYGLIVLPVCGLVGAASLASGPLAKLWGEARSVHFGLAAGSAGLLAMPLIHTTLGLGVLAGVMGLGFVIAMPAWLAQIITEAPPRIRGSVIGALGIGQGLGVIFGTMFSSILYVSAPLAFLGLNSRYTPFLGAAAALAVAFLLSLVYVRTAHQPAAANDSAPSS